MKGKTGARVSAVAPPQHRTWCLLRPGPRPALFPARLRCVCTTGTRRLDPPPRGRTALPRMFTSTWRARAASRKATSGSGERRRSMVSWRRRSARRGCRSTAFQAWRMSTAGLTRAGQSCARGWRGEGSGARGVRRATGSFWCPPPGCGHSGSSCGGSARLELPIPVRPDRQRVFHEGQNLARGRRNQIKHLHVCREADRIA